MDSNNWRPPQSDTQPPAIDGGDWRSQLQPDSRQRIVNKIMETLKRHLPFSGQEELQELKEIAIRFEEKIYSAATSQSDYLRKISLKMLTMESESQSALPTAVPSNSAGVSRNPQDPVASQNMQTQVLEEIDFALQNMNPLLQQLNLIDQQKLFQSQRRTPEAPSTSLDSTAQTSSANGGDWQEEVYQKHDSVPQQPKIDQIEKRRAFKNMLERLMQVLQITKNNILPSHWEKLLSFERQIISLLNSNRPSKPVPSAQIISPQLHSVSQPHSQIPQAHDNGLKPNALP